MRIVIADDHALVIEGLKMCFDSDPEFEVVGVAENGDILMDMVRRLAPDVAIIDITMPGLNGIDAARAISRDESSTTRCVIMSMHGDSEFVTEAFRAGASAYIVKSSSFKELQQAVRTVMSGKTYVSPEIADLLMDSFTGQTPPARTGLARLTPRERQTFQLLAEGLSVKAIALKFGVSHKTVHTYRANILQKLECDGIAELTKLAIRHGLTAVD